jgi:hypothetical protein
MDDTNNADTRVQPSINELQSKINHFSRGCSSIHSLMANAQNETTHSKHRNEPINH